MKNVRPIIVVPFGSGHVRLSLGMIDRRPSVAIGHSEVKAEPGAMVVKDRTTVPLIGLQFGDVRSIDILIHLLSITRARLVHLPFTTA